MQAIKGPDRTAAVFEGKKLSYSELNQRSNQLANYLRRYSVGPESRIGICAERGFEMLIGVLAILKAGAAYVPLDPEHPAERLAYILQDAQASVLLVDESCRKKLDNYEGILVDLDTGGADIAQEDSRGVPLAMHSQNAAYVIYTSGSTGRPKGVVVTHENVVRLFRQTEEWFSFTDKDVWTLFHSYAFDFSVWELWGALLYGGTLVVVPQWVARSPEDMFNLLRAEHVTVLNQTPSAFQHLMETVATSGQKDGLCLRAVIFGGEGAVAQNLRPWMSQYQQGRLRAINMYGITETTVHVTYHVITQEDITQRQAIAE